jgi:hypothetical protein
VVNTQFCRELVVGVQFCRATCGQCTVLSSNLWSIYSSVENLWSVYSSVKQFVVSIQFCQATCGQCTELVVIVQFCQTTCGQCCWVTKGTDTHSGYAKFIAFPEQQFVRVCASVLRYTYITLPVLIKTISKNVVLWEGVMGQNRISLPSKASVSNILYCDKYSVSERPKYP